MCEASIRVDVTHVVIDTNANSRFSRISPAPNNLYRWLIFINHCRGRSSMSTDYVILPPLTSKSIASRPWMERVF